jgi:membrane protease YdiL (CAAX protease family)
MRIGPPWPQALAEVCLLSGAPTQLVVAATLGLVGVRPGPDGRLTLALLAALTLLDTVLLVGLALSLLSLGGESPRAVLAGARPIGGEVLRGFVLLPWVLLLVAVTAVLIALLAPRLVTPNPLAGLASTGAEYVLFAACAMVAAVREEVQRAFILHRCEQRLGGAMVGLAGFGVVFGLGHYLQGWSAVIITALLGTFWGLVYLRRRSVIAPTVSHASFNLIEVIGFGLLT